MSNRNMIVVKDVEVEEVPVDWEPIYLYHYLPEEEKSKIPDPVEYSETVKIETEYIHGKIFVNDKKERVVLGMSQKAQDKLGLPFKAYENMNNRLQENNRKLWEIQIELNDYRKAGIFGALKMLFNRRTFRNSVNYLKENLFYRNNKEIQYHDIR